MTDIALKPCPFCGGNAELNHYPTDGYLPYCPACHGMVENWHTTPELAAAAWNRRDGAPDDD